jgi:hypothetical protein
MLSLYNLGKQKFVSKIKWIRNWAFHGVPKITPKKPLNKTFDKIFSAFGGTLIKCESLGSFQRMWGISDNTPTFHHSK